MSDETREITFRCDDRAGFEFTILHADDGDFHLSISPNKDDLEAETGESPEAYRMGSVRIRMPMIGGGEHEELHEAIAIVVGRKLYGRKHVTLTEDEVQWLLRRRIWTDDPQARFLHMKLAHR